MVNNLVGRPVRIVHFGNDAMSDGGIASVIRHHLVRSMESADISSISTYDSRNGNSFSRSIPFISALHFILSKRGIDVAARITRRRCIVSLHGSGISSVNSKMAFFYKTILKFAHVVHGYADFYRSDLGVSSKKWITVPNDVVVKEQIEFAGKKDVAVFVGEVGHRKGIDLLFDAWNECDQNGWRLIIVGPMSDEVRTSLKVQNLHSSITLLGPQPHEKVLAILEESALVVLPSRAEAFPMTVCEAMAYGCAVVGSDAGAMGELLDSSDQVVVRPLDVPSLAVALGRFLTSPHLVRQSGLKAHMYAVENLSEKAVRIRWERAYGLRP